MNNELLVQISEVESRIKKVRSYLKNSRYLKGMETTEDMFLDYNEFRSCLEIVIKNSYERLIGALKMLREENIYLEFNTSWESDGDYHFKYGKPNGALQLRFSCKASDVPKQLKKLKRR